jgi:hypothetical protein
MSDDQKKAWGYVKNEVLTGKKKQHEANDDQQDATIEQLRSEATAARARISEKLKAYIESISDKASSDSEALSKSAQQQKEQLQSDRQSKLDALVTIPTTASAEEKARLQAINAQKRSDINTDYKTKVAAVVEQTKSQRSSISEQASGDKTSKRTEAGQEREVVSANLKSAISSARAKAKEIQDTLNSSTEDTLDKEYDNIMKNIASKSKSGKSSGKSKSSSSASSSNKLGKYYNEANDMAKKAKAGQNK